jgi:hypothetical protein
MMQSKICRQCGVEKSLDKFYKHKRNKRDGLMTSCKLCHRRQFPHDTERLRINMMRWRNAHREHYRKYQREYQRERKRKAEWLEANSSAQQNVDSA